LNNAFALRKALFGTNPTPKFEYEFQLKPIADALIEVTIDGQKITSEGTASSKLSFPAGTATETGVFINFASTGAASSTSWRGSSVNRSGDEYFGKCFGKYFGGERLYNEYEQTGAERGCASSSAIR
jgi:hypothetical protein